MLPAPHPDERVTRLFESWTLESLGNAAHAAQRLFPTLEDLGAFFRLAFPSSLPLAESTAHGTVRVPAHAGWVSVIVVLNDLEAWRTTPEQLPQASYLAFDAWWLRCNNRTHLLEEPGAVAKMELFLKQHDGFDPDDLHIMYKNASWRDGDAARWMRACVQNGIPAADADYFISGARGRSSIAKWRPERLAELLKDGASIDYIRHFWDWPRTFEKMWDARLPFEYAVALEEAELVSLRGERDYW